METEEGEHSIIDLMMTIAVFSFSFCLWSLAISNTDLNNGDT